MEEVKINLDASKAGRLEIRQGNALPLKEPIKVMITGQIGSITRYLRESTKKEGLIDTRCAYILVNRDRMTMIFYDDPADNYGMEIHAVLETSEVFKKFGINGSRSWTTYELADMIRMNRSYFEKKSDAMDLVTTLRNFEAKINKEIENSDDHRGNTRSLRQQVVQSNLPKGFNLKIPLFKGEAPGIISVEIDIDATELSCRLVSPDAAEIIQNSVNEKIETELTIIAEYYQDLVIIEQ